MAIKVISGKVNIGKELKEVGAKIKMNDAEEERLVNLGFAEYIDEDDEIEVINDSKKSSK